MNWSIASLLFFPTAAAIFTYTLLPFILPLLLKANLAGFDLNKPRENQKEKTPEAAGIITLLAFIIFSPQLNSHLRVSLISAGLLGFIDNVLNLSWGWKIFIPAISLLELSYYSYCQGFIILEFEFLTINFHVFSHFLVVIYSILCQNAVNIYAGINGLEIGQSVVAQSFLFCYVIFRDGVDSIIQINFDFSLLSLIFIFSSISLYQFNKYPAKAFIGDVYTYFAGACYVGAAIAGKCVVMSAFLYFMQLINLGASLPQLLGFVECPRHRLLKLGEDGKLYGQKCNWNNINQFSLKVFRRGLFEWEVYWALIGVQVVGSCLVLVVGVYL